MARHSSESLMRISCGCLCGPELWYVPGIIMCCVHHHCTLTLGIKSLWPWTMVHAWYYHVLCTSSLYTDIGNQVYVALNYGMCLVLLCAVYIIIVHWHWESNMSLDKMVLACFNICKSIYMYENLFWEEITSLDFQIRHAVSTEQHSNLAALVWSFYSLNLRGFWSGIIDNIYNIGQIKMG